MNCRNRALIPTITLYITLPVILLGFDKWLFGFSISALPFRPV